MQPENRADDTLEVPPTPELNLLQIDKEDVEEEIAYWQNAVVCFILGANPPATVIEGFIRRIWTRYNIDKISFLPNGIFLVRFRTLDMKEQVLKAGHFLFDDKPLIVKPWAKNMELHKTAVQVVPVWVQLHGLPIKFWGKSLPKIAGLVGKLLQTDKATENKTKLTYARTLVEMSVDQQCPDQIKFMDEMGNVQTVEVIYEWKPITCKLCKGMGHAGEECRKANPPKPKKAPVKRQVQVWKPVNKTNENKVVARDKPDPVPTIPEQTETRSETVEQGGYSSGKFGAKSYKEILSPTANRMSSNGINSPNPVSHG
ncbi:hypothetical protein vseg_000921 [Gypsophila vaccaria]